MTAGTVMRVSALVAGVLFLASCGSSVVTPSPSAGTPSAAPTPISTPLSTPLPTPPAMDRAVVYVARDRLPPLALHVAGAGSGSDTAARILSRLQALSTADPAAPLINAARSAKARPRAVVVAGDVATVDFSVPVDGWGTYGSTGTRAFVQQIVYTATEEPGIRRALITGNGGTAVIGGEGLVIDRPAAREDVAGYAFAAPRDPMVVAAEPLPSGSLRHPDIRYEVEQVAPALVRVVIDTHVMGSDADAGFGFTITPRPNDDLSAPELAKWAFRIDVPDAQASSTGTSFIDRTPLRSIRTTQEGTTTTYELGLDDLRPWRVAVARDPLRLIVDIGGDPDATTPNVAVYEPTSGTPLSDPFTVRGLVRAFEAHYEYVLRAPDGTILGHGFGGASLGTSEVWGEFATTVRMVQGATQLEVFLRSPKDGEITELVRIPVR